MSHSDESSRAPSARTEIRVAGALVGVWLVGALALLTVEFDSRKRSPHFAAGVDLHGVRVPNSLPGFKPEIRDVNEYDRIEADEDGWVNLDERKLLFADQTPNECFDLGAHRPDARHGIRVTESWNSDPLSN